MELNLRVLTNDLQQHLAALPPMQPCAIAAGRVVACADGIVTVQGLPHARCGELI